MSETKETIQEKETPKESTDENKEKDIPGELNAVIEEYKAAILAHEATIADLRKKNEKLLSLASTKKPEAEVAEKKVLTKPEVEYEGKKYKFRFGAFAFKGIHYEASDVALSTKLIAEIMAVKSQGILKQIF